MRPLAIVPLFLAACGPGYSPEMPLGGRDVPVAILDCIDPQRGLIAAEIESFGWHVSDVGESAVRCADTGEHGGAGQYTLGASEVLVDPAKAPGEAIRQVAGHELVHQLLFRGPRPSTAKLHICDVAYNETYPPGCVFGISAKNALMSPSVGGVWNGNYETVGTLAEYRVTDADRQFIDASIKP